MNLTTATALTNGQLSQLLELWNSEYPEQLGYADLNEFRSYVSALVNPVHFILADDDSRIKAWAFKFTRDGERWFAIILDGSIQRQGVGGKMLQGLTEAERSLNGWVTDHNRYIKKDKSTYPSPMDFYLKNGFVICPGVRLETDKLSAAKIRWDQEIITQNT
jgi:GNAT superfamily N-acetyltransferase